MDANSGGDRTDWFSVKAGNIEKRINISQAASKPSGSIDQVWVDHNVFQGFAKGMVIHVKFSTERMKGKTVNSYVEFYYADNVTPLHNQWGGSLSLSKSQTALYESTTFNQEFFMPYTNLNMAPGWSGTLSFDVIIKDAYGTKLASDYNNTFNFSSY